MKFILILPLILLFVIIIALFSYGAKLEKQLDQEMYKQCEKTEYMTKGSNGLWQSVYKCPQELRELYYNKGIK